MNGFKIKLLDENLNIINNDNVNGQISIDLKNSELNWFYEYYNNIQKTNERIINNFSLTGVIYFF
jgi:acyl-coenzyme A synthetase/AMP-(fatty) acid ligase